MAGNKIRLSEWLVLNGFAENIKEAEAIILSGIVHDGSKKLDKTGIIIDSNKEIFVSGKQHKWVSRGGIKLAHALEEFSIKPNGLVCLDVGCSTGGFTDVLLQNGADKVYAVDVAYGEIAWKLRNDKRVILLERTNAKDLSPEIIPEYIDLLVCDASFISLKNVLTKPLGLVKNGGEIVALIKPQFEASRNLVPDGGIITDPEIHQAVCEDIKQWFNSLNNYSIIGLIESPIKGAEGNKEFLIYVRKNA